MPYNGTDMSAPPLKSNRVKQHRLAQSRSQADVAMAAGISRTGLSAIESQRLVPSVAAALALARALQTSVEDLFDELPQSEADWASVPTRFPRRFARSGDSSASQNSAPSTDIRPTISPLSSATRNSSSAPNARW